MTDTDQRMDERLKAAGLTFRAFAVPDVAYSWPSRRRRAWVTPVAVAAAVAAVVAGVAVVIGSRHSTAPAAPPAKPDRNFAVPPPVQPDFTVGLPYGTHGGVPWRYQACAAAKITTSLRTRATTGGLLGLLRLQGVRCGIQVDENRLKLLDSSGAVLPVRLSQGNPLDSTAYYGPGEFGDVVLGFSWTGSYCGVRPTAVRLLVAGHPVTVPFAGPTPPCRSGSSSLVEGVLGVPGDPVMPAPVSWQSLSARLVLPARVDPRAVPLTVEFTNRSKADISLAVPCPGYRTALSVVVAGSDTTTESSGSLCGQTVTVAAGKSHVVELGSLSTSPGVNPKSGDRVILTWYMSGIESAPSVTAVVR